MLKTAQEIIDFLKKEESIARCETQRDTVAHCSCLGYCLSQILCEHKDEPDEICNQCGKEIKPIKE